MLAEHPCVEVMLIGGRLYKHSIVAVGAAAIEGISRIHADWDFMGVTGVHPHAGLSTGDFEESCDQARLPRARQKQSCSRRRLNSMRRRGSSLVSQSPESKLAPAHGSIGRYRLLEWLNFLSTEIHRGFIPLLYAVAAGKWVDTARPKLESRFGWIDRQLNGQRFLVDEIGVPREYRPRPYRQLQAWYQRIRDRPAVQRVLREDGLLAD